MPKRRSDHAKQSKIRKGLRYLARVDVEDAYACKYGHHDCALVKGGACSNEIQSDLSALGVSNEELGYDA